MQDRIEGPDQPLTKTTVHLFPALSWSRIKHNWPWLILAQLTASRARN